MRIAIVDDDEGSIEFVSQVLRQNGHICVTFHRSRDVPTALQRDTYDLLILDWNMPDLSGMDIVAWARTNLPKSPPVIMLTSRSDKDDVAAALNAGADDFIVKPESAVVIAARVEALLRRTSAQPIDNRIETYGPYVFDRLDESVTLNGEPIVVTSKEFALARLFFANQHKPLSRRYLMETVWKSVAELSTRTLDMHVSRIRSKLNLRSDNGYRLQTVFGYGYRLESF
jgi:DNA-binding response OmpR family regulator